MVIFVPWTDAKVAYWSGRLYKNTFRGTRSTSARMIRTDLAIYLFPRLTCGEGSLSLCGERRLVGAPARSIALARLIVRNRTHNLPRPSVFLWRRPDWYATLASARGTETTIWLFPYPGPMLK